LKIIKGDKMKTIKTEITYKITEHAFSLEDSVFVLEILDTSPFASDEDWSMDFNSLADVYAQIGAFSAKYHMGMRVNTIQEKPIYHYKRDHSSQWRTS
jgi:hypothetical protein